MTNNTSTHPLPAPRPSSDAVLPPSLWLIIARERGRIRNDSRNPNHQLRLHAALPVRGCANTRSTGMYLSCVYPRSRSRSGADAMYALKLVHASVQLHNRTPHERPHADRPRHSP